MEKHERLDRNKVTVMAFYDLVFDEAEPAEAIERYRGDAFNKHCPHVGDGKQACVDYFEHMAAEQPGNRVQLERAIAEGDDAALPGYPHWPGDEDSTANDIFRLDDDGEVVEHGDVLQQSPAASKKYKTML
jgi:predicted SnoaL-like aldol condensation-catalyzing enzyme